MSAAFTMRILLLDLADSTDTLISENGLAATFKTPVPVILDPTKHYSARFLTLNFDKTKVGGAISWDLADTGPENIAGVLDKRDPLSVPLKPGLSRIDFIHIALFWLSATPQEKRQLQDLRFLLIIEEENGARDDKHTVGR